jgi:uncharacterized protein (TIGR02145 family)
MKKLITLSLFIYVNIQLYSQNYQISFSGTGASTTITSIKVENLTQGFSLTLDGTESLYLKATITGINPIYESNSPLQIFPNPASDYFNIEFNANTPGNSTIGIYNLAGEKITEKSTYLEKGNHLFQVTGLINGIYMLRIKSSTYFYSGKLISQQINTNSPAIKYLCSPSDSKTESRLKSANAIVSMQYNTGDLLKITGTSGIYKTIVMDVPTGNKTIPFDFIACTDGDNNNYSIVKIGTQVWMAENLKTTKYQEGSSITNTTDATTWKGLSTGAYCNYNNSETNVTTYGRLYNWFAATDSRKIAPIGWHLPTDAEWTSLAGFLGDHPSGKLKEQGTTHWLSPNTDADNSSGFTALPAGYRVSGIFFYLGSYTTFWSATEETTSNAWARELRYNYSDELRKSNFKTDGYSIRCIKD